MYLENFKQGRGDYSGVGGWNNDGSPTTADVRQYPSNDLGIYGMYGFGSRMDCRMFTDQS